MKKTILVGLGALAMAIAAIACIGRTNDATETFAEYSQGDVISAGKARVWIGYDTKSPFYSYATELKIWTHKNQGNGDAGEHVYSSTDSSIYGTFNNSAESNRRYDYFDISESDYSNGWYLTVQKFENGAFKAQTNPIKLAATNALQVYFIWGDWAWDKTQGTIGAGSIDSVDAGLAAKALAGIHTCSSSAFNGYGAFANYESTFIKNGETWKTVGNLGDYTINDYTSSAYTGAKVSVNAYTKYVAVGNMAKSGKINGVYNVYKFAGGDVNGAAIVGGLAVFGVAAAGTMIFFAKKRKEI